MPDRLMDPHYGRLTRREKEFLAYAVQRLDDAQSDIFVFTRLVGRWQSLLTTDDYIIKPEYRSAGDLMQALSDIGDVCRIINDKFKYRLQKETASKRT